MVLILDVRNIKLLKNVPQLNFFLLQLVLFLKNLCIEKVNLIYIIFK